MIHVTRRVGRNILRTFGWRRGFLHGGANAGVLCHQALFQRLVRSCRDIRSGTGWKQREAKQAGNNLDFHSLGLCKRHVPMVYNYYNSDPKGKHFLTYKKRARIGRSRSIVAGGQSLRSVTRAESSAECSGQFGSSGSRGITSAITRLAASAFATR